jgi:transposase
MDFNILPRPKVANRSRPRTKPENAAMTREKRVPAASGKRHVAVDCLGLILAMRITPASVQDRDAAEGLLTLMVSRFGRLHVIWADGGHVGALVRWVKQLRPFGKLRLEIVRRCDHAKTFKVLPKRWIVERTFGWLYKSRRLCRDYEVRTDHSEAMIRICMIRIMLKRLASAA